MVFSSATVPGAASLGRFCAEEGFPSLLYGQVDFCFHPSQGIISLCPSPGGLCVYVHVSGWKVGSTCSQRCQVFAFHGECVLEDREGLVLILQRSGSIVPCMPAPPSRAVSTQFSRSVVSDSATPWTAARQASLSITNCFPSLAPSSFFLLSI